MQSLDIISVNLWQVLISLINLLLIFLIVKKFLYKPVKKMLAERQAAIDEQYAAAGEAEQSALTNKQAYEQKLATAQDEAEALLKTAADTAGQRRDILLADAREKADGILRQAQAEAELERKKAEADIKREIVDVSALLTEKMLEREIQPQDHRDLIHSFIEKIGDDHDGNE